LLLQFGRYGVHIPAEEDLISSLKRTDLLWVPPCLLFSGYRRSFWGYVGRVAMLTTQVHLVPRWRMSGPINLLPLCVFMICTGANFS